MTESKNLASIDVMKFIAAILVVALHTVPLYEFNNEIALFIRQGITRMAVPFFFVSSGYFLAVNLDNQPTQDLIRVLSKSLYKLGRLYVAWSAVYVVFDISELLAENHNLISVIASYLRDFIFIGSHSHLWYIPALMFSLALGYLSFRTERVKTFFVISLVLYVIGLFGQSYLWTLQDQAVLWNVYANYLAFFETTRNGLFFGFPFVMLGLLIKQTITSSINTTSRSGWYALLCWILYIAEVYLMKRMSGINVYDMYLMLIPLSYYFFVWLLGVKTSVSSRWARVLREYSMGVYFIHGLFWIAFDALWKWLDISKPNTLAFILVTLSSLTSIYILKKINNGVINKFIF